MNAARDTYPSSISRNRGIETPIMMQAPHWTMGNTPRAKNAAAIAHIAMGHREADNLGFRSNMLKASTPAIKHGKNSISQELVGEIHLSATAATMDAARRTTAPFFACFLTKWKTMGSSAYIWTSNGRLHIGILRELCALWNLPE
jgi:hypothetical protein